MASDENLPKCNFEEINRARNDPNILVIDVRELTELQEVGHIPGAINIPLSMVAEALGPEFSDTISGRRSEIAQKQAFSLGYCDVKNYSGGWLDWNQQVKPILTKSAKLLSLRK
ncbi:thiosulfate sulfurtransferase/rhodanese-like domain-containing protein 3 isoform X2 [Euwallacea fornicatus]|uniref:thiosulfate sulfurtransferase/rhodanese-like domain-containing protein 3 isoform X2 n=1 Tax=Euwallacea fornicatus TaxID=995702 RepID=UPI00338D8CE7